MDAQITELVKAHQRYRNSEELAAYVRWQFLQAIESLVLNDEVVIWAMTTTYDNASYDEARAAERVRGRLGTEVRHDHVIRPSHHQGYTGGRHPDQSAPQENSAGIG